MSNNKKCPLFVAGAIAEPDTDPRGPITDCLGERCAWWAGIYNERHDRTAWACALFVLADKP